MTDPNEQTSPEPLQFDRAVDAGDPPPDAQSAPSLDCSTCNQPITTYYYHVDGNAVCAKCKQIAERSGQSQRSSGTFIKAFLLGGLAAVIGAAIYYGVIAITNFEIGLVAILIGFMVGAAVRIGASGGGRRYQVLALLLTYFSVGLAYTPLAIKGAMEAGKSSADSLAVADTSGSDDGDADRLSANSDSGSVVLAATGADSAGAAVTGQKKLGLASALLGVAIVVIGGFLMVFALPVLAVLGSLPSGLISALIIALGMHQAWKMTAGHIASITGPYKVGDAPPGTAAAPGPAPTPAA
jgi:hypothetical protein